MKIFQTIFWSILRNDLMKIRLEWYYIEPEKVFFLKTAFFSKVFHLWKVLNQTQRKLENARIKKCEKIDVFQVFRIVLNDFYQIIVQFSTKYITLTYPLRELLQKKVDFDWTGICNEVFEELKICMSSDTCHSYFDDPSLIRLQL